MQSSDNPEVVVLKIDLSSQYPINALDFKLDFSASLLEFISYDNSKSVVDVWQQNPKLIDENSIYLGGGILAGFGGGNGHIVNLKFKILSEGNAFFSINSASLYQADGLGTKHTPSSSTYNYVIKKPSIISNLDGNKTDPVSNIDTTYPSILVEIVKNPSDGVRLISFNAIDSESGIKEVYMRSKSFFSYTPWSLVENPVTYPKSAWKVDIKVENNQGLVTVRSVFRIINIFYKLFLILLVVLFLVYNILKRKPI